ncbi:MAG: hypothetical protein V2G42_01295 [bacterium JZ-2024 1]
MSGLLARFPLLSTLSVEFSTLSALPLFLAGFWVGGVVIRRTQDWGSAERVIGVLFPGSLAVLSISGVPLLLGYTVSPDIRICSPDIPWTVYGFIAGGAGLTGFFLGCALALFFGRRTFRVLGLILFIVYSVAYSILDMGWGARMTPLNPIIGIFAFYGVASSGTIPAVAWYHRVFYLALILSMVALGVALHARMPSERRTRTLLVSFFLPVLALLLVWCILRRDVDGLLPGTLRLAKYLSEKVESDHIRLYYHSGSFSPENLNTVLGTLEWAYRRNARVLPPLPDRKVSVYLYRSDEKKRLTGAEEVVFASPARYAVHILETSDYALIRHELAHTMLAPFGLPVIRVPLSLPMIEGLADAISRDYAVSSLAHTYVAGVLKNGVLPHADSFMTNPGFLKLHSRLAYAFSGSFIGFLIQKYGSEPVLAAYGGKALVRTLDKSLRDLDAEWREFLSGVPVLPEERKVASDFYNPRTVKPFYSMLCPRERSRLETQVRFLIESRRLEEAEDLLKVYTARDPDHPWWRSAQVDVAIKRKQYSEAENLLKKMASDGSPSNYLLRGWTLLLRAYEDRWLKSPSSPELQLAVKRALTEISRLQFSGSAAVVSSLQLKALAQFPSDPNIYTALAHYCSPEHSGVLLKWAKGRDALMIRVLLLGCGVSTTKLNDFLAIQDEVVHSGDDVLGELFRRALWDWINMRSRDLDYDETVRGLRLLRDLAPPSRRPYYEDQLDITEFLHLWKQND